MEREKQEMLEEEIVTEQKIWKLSEIDPSELNVFDYSISYYFWADLIDLDM